MVVQSLTADQIMAHANPQLPAPEPSTWALLILGFIGLLWKRQKQVKR